MTKEQRARFKELKKRDKRGEVFTLEELKELNGLYKIATIKTMKTTLWLQSFSLGFMVIAIVLKFFIKLRMG
jgi:hypothetical protein